jgi:subtilisin family serine protease
LTFAPTRARRAGLAAAVVLAAGGALAAPASAAASETAPYIVVLKDSVRSAAAVADEHRRSHDARVSHTYEHALKGYAADLTPGGYTRVSRDPRVAYVESDGVVQASTEEAVEPTAPPATWGLDRIDQRGLPLSETYSYDKTGAGVTAYVIDTGIRYGHDEFGDRAVSGFDTFGGDGSDCNGHGTHVAGTVGGATYGVAKGVKLVAVRVLNCSGSGTWSGVIAGVDWVTENHAKPAVANMSLGGGAYSAVDDAVRGSIARGVSYAVAAGNGNQGGKAQDACGYSPARVAEAITIGATTDSDAKTSWSNYGDCVDWFAPGAAITSAWHESDDQTKTISGTSMAAPHTAGVAALYLEANATAEPPTVRDALYSYTTKGIVTSSKTANNHLLHSLEDVDPGTADSGGDGDGGSTKPGNNGKGNTKSK